MIPPRCGVTNVDSPNPPTNDPDLIRRIVAVTDPDLRARAAASILEGLPVPRAVVELHRLQLRGGHAHPERPWLAVARALLDPALLPYDVLRAWYTEAALGGYVGVRYALLDVPARSVNRAHPDPVAGLTLGERRWKARMRDPFLLERLRRDPDPAVIVNVLRNPRTRELDVVLLASQRPAFGDALREVALDTKWGAVADVQLALAHNPYTPTRLAVLLLPLLRPAALRKVAVDGMLHGVVRDVATYLGRCARERTHA